MSVGELETLATEEVELHRRLRDYGTGSIKGRLKQIAERREQLADEAEHLDREAAADLRAAIAAYEPVRLQMEEAVAAYVSVQHAAHAARARYEVAWNTAFNRGLTVPDRIAPGALPRDVLHRLRTTSASW